MRAAIRNILLGTKNDPFFADVVLWLKGDGLNGGTTFVDSSKNNLPITRFGTSITTSTVQSVYGGSSLFSESNQTAARLQVPQSSLFDIGTKNYTIEWWYYKTGTSFVNNYVQLFALDGLDYPFTVYDGVGVGGIALAWGANSSWHNNGFPLTPSSTTTPLNQWVHCALCRKNGILRAFLNGIKTNEVADSFNIATPAGSPTIMGSNDNFYGSMLGHMDDFRFTMAARYENNFNPLTDIQR